MIIRNLVRAAVVGGGAWYLWKNEKGIKLRQQIAEKVKGFIDSQRRALNMPKSEETVKPMTEQRPS